MAEIITIKQGDEIDWLATWRDEAGATVDLTGVVLRSNACDEQGNIRQTFTIELLNQVTNRGQFRIKHAASQNFVAGGYLCDIRPKWPGDTATGPATMDFRLTVLPKRTPTW